MKKISFLFLVIAFSCMRLSAQWTYVGAQDFSVSYVDYISLAIDPSGTPYVAYWDDANSGQCLVQKYSSGSWANVGTPQWATIFNQAYNERIRLSSNGTPYVFYADYNYGGVKKFSAGTWSYVGDSQFTLLRPEYLDLAIAPNGNLYTVFSDYYNNYQPTVYRYNGTSWDTLGTRFLTSDQAYYDGIAVDASNTPYVVFSDNGVSEKATVMKYSGGAWSTVGTRGFSTGQADYTSIAIDNSGTVYVGYIDNTTGKANVKKYSGGSWVTVGTADFSVQANMLNMALDNNGVPYVAVLDGTTGAISVMKLTGSAWTTVGTAGFTPAAADMSFAISAAGVPYVAYSKISNEEISVMKFGGATGVDDIAADAEILLYPNPAGNMIQVTASGFHPETVTVYDLNGQKMIEQPYNGRVDVSALSSGIYLLTLSNAQGSATKRFAKAN